jgi:hypothetical protein
VWNVSSGCQVKESLSEVFDLCERVSGHLTAANWSIASSDRTSWSHCGGNVAPHVIHELLWAKALASRAASMPVQSIAKRKQIRRRAARQQKEVHIGAVTQKWSLPEKLLPPKPGLPTGQDVVLLEKCPARSAAARAWRALRAAAGTPLAPEEGSGGLWKADAAEAQRLADEVGFGIMPSRLLLEVAVLLFAMGSKIGRRSWAQSVSAPLFEASRIQLAKLPRIDDSDLASVHALTVLKGRCSVDAHEGSISRADLLAPTVGNESGQDAAPPRWMRWRLAGYMPLEEVWIFRIGTRRTVHLAAPPPLTWCLEGLALSETAPILTGEEP